MRSIQYNAVPLFVAIAGLVALSQVVPNRGLTPADLDLARTLTTEVSGAAGGVTAELVYAHRFDPVTRGQFDSLLVLYSRRSDQGPAEYFAFVHRNGERLILALDSRGRALQPGDLFLRIGLRRLPDQPPILTTSMKRLPNIAMHQGRPRSLYVFRLGSLRPGDGER